MRILVLKLGFPEGALTQLQADLVSRVHSERMVWCGFYISDSAVGLSLEDNCQVEQVVVSTSFCASSGGCGLDKSQSSPLSLVTIHGTPSDACLQILGLQSESSPPVCLLSLDGRTWCVRLGWL